MLTKSKTQKNQVPKQVSLSFTSFFYRDNWEEKMRTFASRYIAVIRQNFTRQCNMLNKIILITYQPAK